jgi:hypothetical protein
MKLFLFLITVLQVCVLPSFAEASVNETNDMSLFEESIPMLGGKFLKKVDIPEAPIKTSAANAEYHDLFP